MLRSLAIGLLSLGIGVAGCSSDKSSLEENSRLGTSAQADSTLLDLISPATCVSRSGHLISCRVGPATRIGQNYVTAVPLRTAITVQRAGNCSTQYALQATLRADDNNPTVLSYLTQTTAYVRRADGQSMSAVTITDSSPWTPSAVFSSTCDIQLGFSFNEPDVDSKEQAQAIVDKLAQDLAAKTAIANNYHDLVLYQQAYQLLDSVARYFHSELTNDTMQELRAASLASNDALLQLITSCDGGISQDDRINLARLYAALPVVGVPDAWQNPDGTTKSLADFIGTPAEGVLDTVNSLNARHDTDAGTGYDVDYNAAAKAVVTAQAQLTLARQQLSAWLSPSGNGGGQ